MDATWTPRRGKWHALVVRGPSVTGFSFDAVDAGDYERLRPSYSEDAVAWLLTTAPPAHDALVADVAAGTGKLTRMLASAGVAVIAVEPSAAMRTVLRSVTRVPMIAAVAEALPLVNSTLACVCVAQAFHHLDHSRALAELHRVLAPDGHLALVWNLHEATDPLKQAMDRIVDRYVDRAWPAAVFGDWRAVLDRTPVFEVMESRSFEHPHRLRRTPSPICCSRHRTWPPFQPSFGARSLKRWTASRRHSHRRS
jgi:SAM-dependent methyltransferase